MDLMKTGAPNRKNKKMIKSAPQRIKKSPKNHQTTQKNQATIRTSRSAYMVGECSGPQFITGFVLSIACQSRVQIADLSENSFLESDDARLLLKNTEFLFPKHSSNHQQQQNYHDLQNELSGLLYHANHIAFKRRGRFL